MRELDPNVPLSDPRSARMCAEVFVLYGMNARRAARTLRPDLSPKSADYFAQKMFACKQFKREVRKLMNSPEHNAEKYLETLWSWFTSDEDSKLANERKCTAARLLGKSYITERKVDAAPKTFEVDGLDKGLNNLTGLQPVNKSEVM